MHLASLIYASLTPFARGVIRHLVLGFSFIFPSHTSHYSTTATTTCCFKAYSSLNHLVPSLYILSNHILGKSPLEMEKRQPKMRGINYVNMIVDSLPKFHKTRPLMFGTLHHMGVLYFVLTMYYFICLLEVKRTK